MMGRLTAFRTLLVGYNGGRPPLIPNTLVCNTSCETNNCLLAMPHRLAHRARVVYPGSPLSRFGSVGTACHALKSSWRPARPPAAPRDPAGHFPPMGPYYRQRSVCVITPSVVYRFARPFSANHAVALSTGANGWRGGQRYVAGPSRDLAVAQHHSEIDLGCYARV